MDNVLIPQVEWSLSDENMGILERAGLAGLYLSLSAADEWAEKGDKKAIELKKILQWKLDDTQISLFWDKDELQVLTKLIDWSWQVENGVFFLPGIHRTLDQRENKWLRLNTHTGLSQTFFQHNRVLPKDDPESEIITLDEDKTIQFIYRPIKNDLPQIKQLPKFIPKEGINSEKYISLPSWIQPGSAKRFGNDSDELNWTGLVKIGFVLLFAPIICVYFELPRTKVRKKGGKKKPDIGGKKKSDMEPNWAYLIPEIVNLKQFVEIFQMFSNTQNQFLSAKVQGLGDAGLNFAASFMGQKIERNFGFNKLCIIAMGKVNHYQGQNIRKRILEINPDPISIKRYRKMMAQLPNKPCLLKTKKSDISHYIKLPSSRGLIAENIVNNRYWYKDLIFPPEWQCDELNNELEFRKNKENISVESLWFEKLRYEWRNLMNLSNEESMWDSQEEKVFLKVFNDSLRRSLDKEKKALERGGSRDLHKRWESKTDAIRRSLMHAKTLNLTRKVFTELFAEAGGSKELTQNKELVWKFVNHPYDWQKARDLGLLGLATFVDGRLKQDNESKKEEIENE